MAYGCQMAPVKVSGRALNSAFGHELPLCPAKKPASATEPVVEAAPEGTEFRGERRRHRGD